MRRNENTFYMLRTKFSMLIMMLMRVHRQVIISEIKGLLKVLFLLSGSYHPHKTTIEKFGVIWGGYSWRQRVALPHFQHSSPF